MALAEKTFERTTFKLKSVRNTGYRGIIIGVLPTIPPGKNEMLARCRSPNVSCYFLSSCLEQFIFYFCLFHELKLAASVLETVLGVTRYSETARHDLSVEWNWTFLNSRNKNRHEFESQWWHRVIDTPLILTLLTLIFIVNCFFKTSRVIRNRTKLLS